MNITEPTLKTVAEMIAWSGISGNHDGNGWDVRVMSYGGTVEIVVTPYDMDDGEEVPAAKRAFKLVVQDLPLPEVKWAGRS